MSYHIPQRHVVHKHKLELDASEYGLGYLVEVALQADAQITLFAWQENGFYIWEYHNIDFPTRTYSQTFYLTPTGTDIPEYLLIIRHVQSLQVKGQIWHLFDVSDQRGNLSTDDHSGG